MWSQVSERVCLMKIPPTAGDCCCSAETLQQRVHVPFLLLWQALLINWAQLHLSYANSGLVGALLSAFSYQATTWRWDFTRESVSGSLCQLAFKRSERLIGYRSFTSFAFASTEGFSVWRLHKGLHDAAGKLTFFPDLSSICSICEPWRDKWRRSEWLLL